ncbi:MAG: ribonuclease HI [Planctomycetes bacterium]|nr:ribonuclease HI [Planctomycetota bacterium]
MVEATDVMLYTDGACLGNPGPGGWAYIHKFPASGREVEVSGGEAATTNNRMELTAVIEGLASLDARCHVTLVGDSEYVLKGISEWLPGWKKRGWRKADKKPVLNADLWQRVDELLQTHQVKVQWTRGHAGHPENERCDELASAEALRHKR